MKQLLDNKNLICTMFLLNNPETNTPELVIHFTNFENETQAFDFADLIKEDARFHPVRDTNITVH